MRPCRSPSNSQMPRLSLVCRPTHPTIGQGESIPASFTGTSGLRNSTALASSPGVVSSGHSGFLAMVHQPVTGVNVARCQPSLVNGTSEQRRSSLLVRASLYPLLLCRSVPRCATTSLRHPLSSEIPISKTARIGSQTRRFLERTMSASDLCCRPLFAISPCIFLLQPPQRVS